MDLTSLRVWQWMIVGLLAGAVVGFAWSSLPNDLERTGDRDQFRMLARLTGVLQKQNASGKLKTPAIIPIRNVIVCEPETDPSNVLIYPVRFELIQRQPRRRTPDAKAAADPTYSPTGIYAPTPFEGTEGIREFLTRNGIAFTDRTGARQYMPVCYGAAAGFVGIGLIWPAAIRLMLGAGLATPKPKKTKVPKHRTGEDVDEMLAKPTGKPIDTAALGALNDAMERKLAGSLTSGGPRASVVDADEPVSVLMSGTGARSAADPTLDRPVPLAGEEKKDFAGEYYPVARPTKHDDDPH